MARRPSELRPASFGTLPRSTARVGRVPLLPHQACPHPSASGIRPAVLPASPCSIPNAVPRPRLLQVPHSCCRANSRSCISQNLPCSPAHMATRLAFPAFGCICTIGKCRKASATSSPSRVRSCRSDCSLHCLQNGHWKSLNSAIITFAFALPSISAPTDVRLRFHDRETRRVRCGELPDPRRIAVETRRAALELGVDDLFEHGHRLRADELLVVDEERRRPSDPQRVPGLQVSAYWRHIRLIVDAGWLNWAVVEPELLRVAAHGVEQTRARRNSARAKLGRRVETACTSSAARSARVPRSIRIPGPPDGDRDDRPRQ